MLPEEPTALLVNPHARIGREQYQKVREALGNALNLVYAEAPDAAVDFCQAMSTQLDAGIGRFVIGGGDGTLSVAANLLAGRTAVMGVMPLGTGNTFASSLNLPPLSSLGELSQVMAAGAVIPIDLGVAQSEQGSRYFLNTATFGMSERLTQLLTPESKRRLGWLAWPKGVGKAMAATPVFQVRLHYQHRFVTFRTRQLIIAKGRNLAGSVFILNRASHQDRTLHVFSLGGKDWLSLLRVGMRLWAGGQISARFAHYCAVQHIEVSTEPLRNIDIDGEVWASAPCAFAVEPQALQVIARQPG
jgi:diacylglycerol kinase family enzyme